MHEGSVSISLQWELNLPPRCHIQPAYNVLCCADNVCVRGNAHYSQAGSEILVSAELMDVSPHTEFICGVDAALEGQQRTHASINVTSDVTGNERTLIGCLSVLVIVTALACVLYKIHVLHK
ncbi:unnamed protein product [Lampetra planeri]